MIWPMLFITFILFIPLVLSCCWNIYQICVFEQWTFVPANSIKCLAIIHNVWHQFWVAFSANNKLTNSRRVHFMFLHFSNHILLWKKSNHSNQLSRKFLLRNFQTALFSRLLCICFKTALRRKKTTKINKSKSEIFMKKGT